MHTQLSLSMLVPSIFFLRKNEWDFSDEVLSISWSDEAAAVYCLAVY